jgi:fibro-slime domain-containing protein
VNFPFRKTTRDGVIYYEFDSRYDVARFNRNGQLDYYTGDIDPYIAYDRHDGVSFLPYNKPSDPHKAVNYCFGMKLEIPFYMTEDGKIDGKDLEFRFSGDDDVWIFVDGELVLDLGGCHRRIYGVINFSEQTGLVEAVCNPRVVFSNRVITIPSGATHYTDARAGVYNEPVAYYNVEKDFSESLKAKFEDSTKLHTITIFYMERAKGASNLEISYNLLAQDSTRIVDGEYHLFELH